MNNKQSKKLDPIEKAEDVEFSYELADSEDLEAMERMKKADQRAENQNK
ncbi:YfhD family protein [Aquibacillus kalidii]|nr:YfhD family protein [Aquibacillus kalidii]